MHCSNDTTSRGTPDIPLVSVILPVRNGATFLASAIDSILAQTYTAFELIVIDDGSTDDTRSIVAAAAKRDSRIVALRLDSCGLAGALNAGLRVARGRYIARMDADDVALPERLGRQVAHLDGDSGCVAVGTDTQLIDSEGEPLGLGRYPRRHRGIMSALLCGARAFSHPAVMMRKDAVAAVEGYRSDHFPSEDIDLWLRLAEHGTFANLPEPLLRYRRHPGAVSFALADSQSRTTKTLIDDARRKRGLEAWAGRRPQRHDERITYHLDCARSALSAGRRSAVVKHALPAARRAPIQGFAMLVICALPLPCILWLARGYRIWRNRLSTS